SPTPSLTCQSRALNEPADSPAALIPVLSPNPKDASVDQKAPGLSRSATPAKKTLHEQARTLETSKATLSFGWERVVSKTPRLTLPAPVLFATPSRAPART